jgi:hypothetical protein
LVSFFFFFFFFFPPFRHNSVYHSIFYKFVVTIIKSNDVPTLKNLFTKTKFLTRMIEHYADEKNIGCRGYIILICNVLRLTCDSQKPSDYIPTMLLSHHTWKDFEPKLRADTMAQVELTVEDDPTFQRPLPHVGPLSITQENDDMISFLARILKAGDIDLGSQCRLSFSSFSSFFYLFFFYLFFFYLFFFLLSFLLLIIVIRISCLLPWLCWKLP